MWKRMTQTEVKDAFVKKVEYMRAEVHVQMSSMELLISIDGPLYTISASYHRILHDIILVSNGRYVDNSKLFTPREVIRILSYVLPDNVLKDFISTMPTDIRSKL